MKIKILVALIIVSSLFGYLEWGNSQSSFLFQAEFILLKGIIENIGSVLHPLTIIPLLGQVLLLLALFQNKPRKIVIYIGISSLAILFLLMLLVGILAKNIKILTSTVPFFVFVILTIKSLKTK